jgi:hypothetical protein
MEFESALQALCDGGVEFVIIGGVAAALHGSARLTDDLDIYYVRSAEAFARRVAALDLRALIRAKRATGRQKDAAALPELESLLEAEQP